MNMLEHLPAVLQTTPLRWTHLTAQFSDEMLRCRPQPGEWSALECLVHLIDLDRSVFPVRVQAILDGKPFPAFFPERDGTVLTAEMSAGELAEEFAILRTDNLPLVKRLTADDLQKEAHHEELGTVSLENLLGEWGAHDLMHLVQAEQALMQPFIAASGAWQVYFTDHLARPDTS
jgi:hypothetical protein